MDNEIPVRKPVARFGPDRRIGAAAAVAAGVAIVVAALGTDPQARLFTIVTAVVLAAIAVADLAYNPRLVADAHGLTIRSPSGRLNLPWPAVDSLRLDQRSRLGLTSRALEIEAGPQLIVLGRHSLGRDPSEVYDLVRAFKDAGSSQHRRAPSHDEDDQDE